MWYFIHHGQFQMHLCSKTYAQAHWPGHSPSSDCRSWWRRRSRSALGGRIAKGKVETFFGAPALVRPEPPFNGLADTSGPAQNKPGGTRTYRYGSQSLAERFSRHGHTSWPCLQPKRCLPSLRVSVAVFPQVCASLSVLDWTCTEGPEFRNYNQGDDMQSTPAAFSIVCKTSVWGPYDMYAPTSPHEKGPARYMMSRS